MRCNPTSSSDGPARVREPKGRHNTRSKDHKTGLRSKATIEVIQQSQKDDCEGLYTPTKLGIKLDVKRAVSSNGSIKTYITSKGMASHFLDGWEENGHEVL